MLVALLRRRIHPTAGSMKSVQLCKMIDPILQEVINFTLYGWPDKEQSIRPEIGDYFASRYNYSVCDDLFYKEKNCNDGSL